LQNFNMRLPFLILLLFAGTVAAAQTDEEKLTVTLKDFHQALVNKNTVSINQQTDKALSYGHSNGWVQTKADVIRDLETGYIVYRSYKEDSIVITMNGNMANARFIADVSATLKGNTVDFHLKVLEVWVKKGKRWVLFARQAVKALSAP
jgi:serine/threonine protein kinase